MKEVGPDHEFAGNWVGQDRIGPWSLAHGRVGSFAQGRVLVDVDRFRKVRASGRIVRAPHPLSDESDPDTELPQIEHALQAAEAIRRDGHPRWFILTGLIW